MVGQGVCGALGFTEMAKVGEIPHGKAFLDLRPFDSHLQVGAGPTCSVTLLLTNFHEVFSVFKTFLNGNPTSTLCCHFSH